MTVKTVRVVIKGRVQGVWFRGWVVERAERLALAGWIRNRRDGTVEALFSGASETVDEMLADCRKGPPLAKVVSVTEYPAEPPDIGGFQARATT